MDTRTDLSPVVLSPRSASFPRSSSTLSLFAIFVRLLGNVSEGEKVGSMVYFGGREFARAFEEVFSSSSVSSLESFRAFLLPFRKFKILKKCSLVFVGIALITFLISKTPRMLVKLPTFTPELFQMNLFNPVFCI